MNLSGLIPLINRESSYQALVDGINKGKVGKHVAVLDAAKPYLLACLYRELCQPMFVITAKPDRARQLHEEIPIWLGSDDAVWLLPEPDTLPYERLSSDSYTIQQRLRIFAGLVQSNVKPLVIASAHAAVWKTMPTDRFATSLHTLKQAMKIDLQRLLSKWLDLGYEMENRVELPGTVCRRGGIIDVYSPHSDLPARIELFGDEIESIRLYDPATQRSIETVSEISIIPAREMIATPA